MSFTIRPLEPGDDLRHRELKRQAFAKGGVVDSPAENAEPPDVKNSWGLFVGDDLQAALTIAPFQAQWGADTVLPLGGIAAVATWAQARGNGYVAALLTESLRIMCDRGEVVSALYPFAWGFYRKFGWEWVGEKRKIILPLRELRAAPEGKAIRDITERDAQTVRPQLESTYTGYAKQFRGVFTPETHRWERILAHGDRRTTYVYQYEPTGEYLLWRYDGSRGRVTEWVAWTPEGFRAHLSLLHYLGTQCDKAEVFVPGTMPLWAHLMHWDMETKTDPVFMARVVDFAGALRALPPVPDVPNGALTVALSDKHAPWNDGVWRVAVESGRIICEKAGDGATTADITLDIQALSQAFWGMPSLQWLRNAGRITSVTNEAAWGLLCRLLPAHPVYTLDDF